MNKRMSIIVVVVVVAGSVLTACGGGAPAPISFGQLPVFTGATETTNTALNEAMATQIERAKSDTQIKGAEGKVYDLPADTTWDVISSFYKTALEKAGWTVAQSGDNLLAFSRGKQAFVINYAPGPVLITVLTETR